MKKTIQTYLLLAVTAIAIPTLTDAQTGSDYMKAMKVATVIRLGTGTLT